MVRLAVDIDGVLCDTFSYWKIIAEREGVTKEFSSTYDGIYKVLCKDGQIFGNKLFREHQEEWLVNSKPYEYVSTQLNDFDNLKWYIVTSREPSYKLLTLSWLDNNNITGFEDVIFTNDKTTAPTNVIVDDYWKHVKSYVESARKAFLMDRPYNRHEQVGIRVTNLNEVYKQLI